MKDWDKDFIRAREYYPQLPTDSGVYIIRNVITDDLYVGAAGNIRTRCSGHRTLLRQGRHSKKIQAAYNAHGASAFSFEVFALCSLAELADKEEDAISLLNPAYNTSPVYDYYGIPSLDAILAEGLNPS